MKSLHWLLELCTVCLSRTPAPGSLREGTWSWDRGLQRKELGPTVPSYVQCPAIKHIPDSLIFSLEQRL